MKNAVFIYFILVIAISCHKDEIIFIPNQTYTINSNELLSKLIETPDTNQILIESERTLFFGPENIIVDIPAQSLVDDLGNVVSGVVKIQFKEFSNKKSNLLFSPSTIFENKELDCSKVFFIRFSQNGKELKYLKPIDIYLPSEDLGSDNQLYSATNKDNKTVWKMIAGESENIKIKIWNINYYDAQLNIKGYKLSIGNTSNWFCIARQPDHPKIEINVCLNTTMPFDKNNSLVYLVSKNNKSSIKLLTDEDSSLFCIHNLILHQNLDGKIIIISHLGNENYYFGMTNVVSDSNINITLNPEKKNITEIKEALKSL